ncbi:MAG: hypothetical protein ACFCVK_11525 [Acidimicrobiales bacterium]
MSEFAVRNSARSPVWVIRNTAERVLDEVNCSVATIKPEGFVSPIKWRVE